MYLQHYGFTKDPFHITPDPRFFYLSSSHREAFASMVYGLKKRKGFIAVIGEVGLGKTTVVRSFLQQKSRQAKLKTMFIFNPKVTFQGLLRFIYEELEIVPPDISHNESDDTSELVKKLHQALIDEYSKGYLLVLVIDEAQNMPIETLENLRMLSNLETGQDKLLQIFLIGQPELEQKLNRPELRQLKQRLAIRSTLKPLNKKESIQYIEHRLKRAGLKKQTIFSRRAINRIFQYSRGNPRIINILCDNALVTGFGYGTTHIGSQIIEEVQRDIQGNIPKSRRLAWTGALAAAIFIIGGGLVYSQYENSIKREIMRFPITQKLMSMPKLSANELSQANKGAESPVPQPDLTTQKVPKQPTTNSPVHSVPKKNPQENDASSAPQSQGFTDHDDKHLSSGSLVNRTQQTDFPESAYSDSVLDDDLDKKGRAIRDELGNRLSVFKDLTPVRQKVLIAMTRQTSIRGLMTFDLMIAALKQQDYLEAARQMIDSHWGDRTGLYAIKLAEIMYTGHPQGWNSADSERQRATLE